MCSADGFLAANTTVTGADKGSNWLKNAHQRRSIVSLRASLAFAPGAGSCETASPRRFARRVNWPGATRPRISRSFYRTGCDLRRATASVAIASPANRNINRDSFDFRPFARLIFSANHSPATRYGTRSYFDRWLLIPFERRFRGSKCDVQKHPGCNVVDATGTQWSSESRAAGPSTLA